MYTQSDKKVLYRTLCIPHRTINVLSTTRSNVALTLWTYFERYVRNIGCGRELKKGKSAVSSAYHLCLWESVCGRQFQVWGFEVFSGWLLLYRATKISQYHATITVWAHITIAHSLFTNTEEQKNALQKITKQCICHGNLIVQLNLIQYLNLMEHCRTPRSNLGSMGPGGAYNSETLHISEMYMYTYTHSVK